MDNVATVARATVRMRKALVHPVTAHDAGTDIRNAYYRLPNVMQWCCFSFIGEDGATVNGSEVVRCFCCYFSFTQLSLVM